MKLELDPKKVATEIVNRVDAIGSGLSTAHEAKLTREIEAILTRHEQETK